MRALLTCLVVAGTAGAVHAQCLTDRLHPPTGVGDGLFGYTLALEGDFLAVGAPADFFSPAAGQVALLERNATGGFDALTVLQHPQASPFFGSGVAFSGGRLAVGDTGAGKFFFYEHQAGTWTALAETAPVTGLANLFYERPYIGGASPNYSFDGIYINGYFTVYRETTSGYALHHSIVGAPDEWLGLGLGFADRFIAVGSPGYGSSGEFAEPSHVTVWEYFSPDSPPSVLTEMYDPLGFGQTRFGRAIAMTNERLVVGAGSSGAQLDRLETYRFLQPDLVFQHTGRILPPPQGSFDGPLALDGTTLLASGKVSFSTSTVFHYEWSGTQWELRGQLPLLGTPFAAARDVEVEGATAVLADFSEDLAWTWDLAGACPGLVAAPATVSLSAGGAQDWLASFGPSSAGDVYWVVGSASGTAPGIPLGSVVLPLVPDAWTTVTIASANLGPFQANLGVLGANGTAVAALLVPAAADPALAGLVLHHAAVVIDAASVTATAVSVPTELEFVP